ncbi:DnaJ domain-containing protein [Ancylobacter dichloromethanicus]|uniref:Molecular chaperone DnaJ n=1 Tax=Ancylobacter dichloromethanicus TaxID=518825 RepID=A0A9W6J8R2_9HYPH|nr:DnaJ domain-containing protein [Ancylobacter dichloromethanicus]MBS7554662.1 DnaJ domain-containing protein [Ancylobacter dichloromethanicus]GLK71793.1 molecular chaperone DnaJ [Ancylobacter dichloromethanicus]
MINLVIGAAIVALLYYGLKAFGRANPAILARLGRRVGGGALILVAGFVGMRGHIETALPLGIFGLSLLGWDIRQAFSSSRSEPSAGRASKVRTPFLDMELDHDSGRLGGKVTNGPLAGAGLDTLDVPTLARLALDVDQESRQLLEAYLDRRSPGWREHADGQAGRRSADTPRRGAMTEEEAYQILGLQPGTGADEIRKAHRSLMKKLHPDQGGSNYLAARVNEAKDVLLDRH